MRRHRALGAGGGCTRRSISLSVEMAQRVDAHLAGTSATFSAFVADALEAWLPKINPTPLKKKVR